MIIAKVQEFVIGSLDALDTIIDHRMTGMMLWITYFAVQDLLKDSDVQTIIASPASIEMMTWSSWVFIAMKASLPVLGGVITYKSDTWAKKGTPKITVSASDFTPPTQTDSTTGPQP